MYFLQKIGANNVPVIKIKVLSLKITNVKLGALLIQNTDLFAKIEEKTYREVLKLNYLSSFSLRNTLS